MTGKTSLPLGVLQGNVRMPETPVSRQERKQAEAEED